MLTKRGEELNTQESTSKRRCDDTSGDQVLFDAIEGLETVTNKATRDVRNLVAGKNRPQQVMDKWMSKFCEPSIQLVRLTEQVRSARDESEQQLAMCAEDIRYQETAVAHKQAKFEEDFAQLDSIRETHFQQRDTQRQKVL
jgi:hypothetical protein